MGKLSLVMKMKTGNDFNFDEWVKLAQQDTEIFEKKRSEYLKNFIDQVPEKYHERMVGIQWVLDMERSLSPTPMASCLKMYNQMWDSFCGTGSLSEEINALLDYLNSNPSRTDVISSSGSVFIKDNVVSFV